LQKMWDDWFMSTTRCTIITTRCRLRVTSTTAFHRLRREPLSSPHEN